MKKGSSGVILVSVLLIVGLLMILTLSMLSILNHQQKLSRFKIRRNDQQQEIFYTLLHLFPSFEMQHSDCHLQVNNLQNPWVLLQENDPHSICYKKTGGVEIKYIEIANPNFRSTRIDIMARNFGDLEWQNWQMEMV